MSLPASHFSLARQIRQRAGWLSYTKPITKEKVVEKSDRTLVIDWTEVHGVKRDAVSRNKARRGGNGAGGSRAT